MTIEKMQQLTAKIVELDSIQSYQFIKRRRLNKEITAIKDEMMNDDIFKASEFTFSYLLGSCGANSKFGQCIVPLSNDAVIMFTDTTMDITLDEERSVVFYPTLNRFAVIDTFENYTIYRNNPVPHILTDKWNKLSTILKQKYLEAIVNITCRTLFARSLNGESL